MTNANHPQFQFTQTTIDPNSFFGKLRRLYSGEVLHAQLVQLRKTGRYDAFKLGWHPVYDTPGRKTTGACAVDEVPPSLFWESDIGKWIEATCYFLQDPHTKSTPHRDEFIAAIEELIEMIKAAQQPDGYLNIYFTIVDPSGRFKNLRDLHELYNAGHLLEAALAHFQWSHKTDFLDIMIRNIECISREIGPEPNQKHGYPGHPELELALLRLSLVTGEERYKDLAGYFLRERGKTREDLDGLRYFHWEAKKRDDVRFGRNMKDFDALWYFQAHAPLLEQPTIQGHSVRAFYLLTAAADYGEEFLDTAKRLWDDAVGRKMYVTGGFGSIPQWEGFPEMPYFLPPSSDEGGCYAETCASIGALMLSERLISRIVDSKYRDLMELMLYNTIIGGGSLDGRAFSYGNRLGSSEGDEAIRSDWFEVSCCPPNLSRTLGLLGGYTWKSVVSETGKVEITVYLFVSATLTVNLPNDGGSVVVEMETDIPSSGGTKWNVKSPVEVTMKIPIPKWSSSNWKFSVPTSESANGFVAITLPPSKEGSTTFQSEFEMKPRILAPNHLVVPGGTDTLTVARGPFVYVAEDVDNPHLVNMEGNRHFRKTGILESAKFEIEKVQVGDFVLDALRTKDVGVLSTPTGSTDPYTEVKERKWEKVDDGLLLIPFFARGNRGGKGRYRVPLMRISGGEMLQ